MRLFRMRDCSRNQILGNPGGPELLLILYSDSLCTSEPFNSLQGSAHWPRLQVDFSAQYSLLALFAVQYCLLGLSAEV